MCKEEEKKASVDSITTKLVKAICDSYAPSGPGETMELKSTTDIMEDMAAIADVDKSELANALDSAGFKLQFTEAGIYWKLFRVT